VNPEPRQRDDYSERQIEAARRVLVDLGQILAKYADCLVVVGGWVPDLLLADADEPHIGSIDVDLALDVAKLNDGRYADILKLLGDTKRYRKGAKDFQLLVTVDLMDEGKPLEVEVEFLAPKEVKMKRRSPKLLTDFRDSKRTRAVRRFVLRWNYQSLASRCAAQRTRCVCAWHRLPIFS
jgi:tRNA nucleotidyltransferase/poly(A) polymerase